MHVCVALFFAASHDAHRYTACEIVVRIDQSLIRTAATKDCISCDCPHAVNTAHSLGGWPDVALSGAISKQKSHETQQKWAAAATSSASPAARTACSVRGAASQVLFTNSLPGDDAAVLATSASESRDAIEQRRVDGVHDSVIAGSADLICTNNTKTQAWSRACSRKCCNYPCLVWKNTLQQGIKLNTTWTTSSGAFSP